MQRDICTEDNVAATEEQIIYFTNGFSGSCEGKYATIQSLGKVYAP
jgi:hypothetical protein